MLLLVSVHTAEESTFDWEAANRIVSVAGADSCPPDGFLALLVSTSVVLKSVFGRASEVCSHAHQAESSTLRFVFPFASASLCFAWQSRAD
eukprot:224712-Lingulodinium_polyedra.AAC.1